MDVKDEISYSQKVITLTMTKKSDSNSESGLVACKAQQQEGLHYDITAISYCH